MVDRNSIFRELKYEVMKVFILEAFLSAMIVFLSLNIVLSMFAVKYYFPLAIGWLYFVFALIFRMRRIRLRHIEDKNPNIMFMLRTASDYKKKESFLSFALFEDLVNKLKHVSVGNILNKNRTGLKVLVIIILCFATVSVASKDIDLRKFGEPFEDAWRGLGKKVALPFYGIEFNETEDIYGDANIAQLGNEQIQMNISQSINEVNLNQVKDVEEEIFEEGTFPYGVYAKADAPSEESLPKESKIAIEYNLKVNELVN